MDTVNSDMADKIIQIWRRSFTARGISKLLRTQPAPFPTFAPETVVQPQNRSSYDLQTRSDFS